MPKRRFESRLPALRFSFAAFIFCAWVPAVAAASESIAPAGDAPASAHVVLVGEAGQGDELTGVLSELLVRQNVTPEFERRERFRTSALLTENQGDARVWVFIALGGPHSARLYFRGPFGNRFLLRELSLRDGLDELGRELIAQVVESSTVALLRSEAGLSREEAKRDLTLQAEANGDVSDEAEPPVATAPPVVEPEPKHAAAPANEQRRFVYELALRGAGTYTGSDLGVAGAIGAETGLAWRASKSLFVRGRVAFEYGFSQSFDAGDVSAKIRPLALRAGVDIGSVFGSSALAVGASGGADLVAISPQSTGNSLDPAPDSHSTTPVVRVEARYELTLGAVLATGGVFADVPLVDTHYDVRQGSEQSRVAEPWAVRPGICFTVGWAPAL